MIILIEAGINKKLEFNPAKGPINNINKAVNIANFGTMAKNAVIIVGEPS